MEFSIKSGSPEKQRTACVVVGIFEPRRLSAAGEQIDEVSSGYLANIIRRGDIEGKPGQTLLMHNVPNMLCDRVLLVGCGRERDFNENCYITTIKTAVKTLNETGSMDAVCFLPELTVKGRDIYWKVRQAVQASEDVLYVFDKMKSEKDKNRRPIRKMTLNVVSRRDLTSGEKALKDGQAIAAGVEVAKTLGNLPGNICTPSYLATQAKALVKGNKKLNVTVLDEPEIKKLGMGSFLSVAMGSRQAPKLIVMEYNGGKKDDKPYVLVGKGITFDSGGISIKPPAAMDEMKYDMGGAASVLGTIKAISQMKLPLNVVGIVPSCENMPDGMANKPGDIVTSMSGQTIEVLNTDAEGRLILCDALTYSEKFDPVAVIDIATLTGACVIALGKHASGLLGNHRGLVNDLLAAGKSSHDRAWELPLWDEYQEQLKSNFADMANIGGRDGGTITAACFLSRFTRKLHWAHLDIAGTAWLSGPEKGGTGRPVPLLTQYLMDRAGQ
jgi:leucyl aminopeptidase